MEKNIDLFLFISCWTGLDNEWTNIASPQSASQKLCIQVIQWLKLSNIPTIFWGIEDPPLYGNFINIAKECDFIYTTAEEKVQEYQKDCLNPDVYVMPFGINPLLHNPINMNKYQFNDKVFFAGSWYNDMPERCIDMKMLFDSIIASSKELCFIDRNFAKKAKEIHNIVPSKYKRYLYPSIEHKLLQKVQKCFPWCLNVSTVKDSFTMFANRIPELQAQGRAVISNYSVSVNSTYPNIFTVFRPEEVEPIFNSLTEEELFRHRCIGIRKVMENDTYFQKLSLMLSNAGINIRLPKYKVLVVAEKITPKILKMFHAQILSEEKSLIALENFNEQIKNEYDMIAFWGDNREYEEFYLQDMIHAFKYTHSSYVTKHSFYQGGTLKEGIVHDYTDIIIDWFATLFWSADFTYEQLANITENFPLPNGYAIHPFEYISYPEVKAEKSGEYKLSVIVPCYNNGDHLWSKCFLSLKRSSMFKDMEILLIDDGSTDHYTTSIINRIAKQFPNVKTYFYPEGGSGSASRPRNHGIALSSAPYVTYLDPDNEAVFDGYASLYKKITKKHPAFIVGYMEILELRQYDYKILKNLPSYKAYPGKRLLIDRMKWMPQSMQAMIFNKQWLKDKGILLVEGALGEDTLFFYELAASADRVAMTNIPVHIYYAAVKGSSVNRISIRFFERSYKMEQAQVRSLEKHNILTEYVHQKFCYMLRNWYLGKLSKTDPASYQECLTIVYQIYQLYEPYIQEKLLTPEELKNYKAVTEIFKNNLRSNRDV